MEIRLLNVGFLLWKYRERRVEEKKTGENCDESKSNAFKSSAPSKRTKGDLTDKGNEEDA